jgi:thymidylate synthase ThyX
MAKTNALVIGDSNDDKDWIKLLEQYTNIGNKLYHDCLKDLSPVLGRKRAKESARFFKTYNSQIQSDIMFNMRSFANFLKLRLSPNAQLEIREIAQQMLHLVKNIEGNPFKYTLEAWGYQQ